MAVQWVRDSVGKECWPSPQPPSYVCPIMSFLCGLDMFETLHA